MAGSTTNQWILSVLWVILLLGALYALAMDSNLMFQIIAWVAIALGIIMSALQLRRRREKHD